MICPNCGDEYREGLTECAECRVPLVAKRLEEHQEPHHPDLVTIYTAVNASLVPVIESVLRGAGIQFLLKSERVQDLFGWGRIGLGYNAIVGPVQVQVTTDDQEAAQELLKEIEPRPGAEK
jgi:Putative prokaryotic signal transducing protein